MKKQEEKAEQVTEDAVERRVVEWDMRNLVAERLRAEAGADVAHGAAVGERVRINDHIVGQNVVMIKKVKQAIAPAATGIDVSVAAAAGDASRAAEAEKRVQMLFKAAKGMFGPTLRSTRAVAVDLIKEQARAAAQEEAEAYAERMDWDKPERWADVLANRAAEPYSLNAAMAAQRASQYRASAGDLTEGARAAWARAVELAPHVRAMEVHGDKFGAFEAAREIQALRARSQRMESRAKQFGKMAHDAWKSVSQWTAAEYAASAHAAYAYQSALATAAPQHGTSR